MSLFLTMWFLVASFLAVNHALHRSLHEEAGHDSHQCALTLLEQQQIQACNPLSQIVKLSSGFFSALPLPAMVAVSADDLRLAPGRAPPV